MTISRVCWDTGGIDGEIVYQRSKTRCFPGAAGKGASVYGKPVITMPKPAISGACICVKWERTPQKKFSMPV